MMVSAAPAAKTIVLLAGAAESTDILFNALDPEFGINRVIVEMPARQNGLLKRRVEHLGWQTVLGQVAFGQLIAQPLRRSSQPRLRGLKMAHKLNDQPVPADRAVRVPSVNAPECLAMLHEINPDVVVVNGTRIIAAGVLTGVPCPFINMHAGITPLYRGVHGGYWALANDDAAHCGVSVHLVDAGIDTGGIIAQALIQPGAADNFATYPLLQLIAGLPLLRDAVRAALAGTIQLQPPPEGHSRLWSHPTWAQYRANRRHNGTR